VTRAVTRTVFRISVPVKVSIVVALLLLLNNILNNLINKDIKGLNIASATARNNKDYSVKLFKFIYKVICVTARTECYSTKGEGSSVDCTNRRY
jgi:hypothetical protein